jgi:hypothetical protein
MCRQYLKATTPTLIPEPSNMLLTKHDGVTFQNQTVYISGQAFIRCRFVGCTLVLRETVYYLEACTFERCNWHVDWVMMWGSPESIREIKALVALIEQSHAQLPQTGAMQTQPRGAGNIKPAAPASPAADAATAEAK